MVVNMIEENFNQPFKTGPLIDQQGNYALFDILMNDEMFKYIVTHRLYNKAEQMSDANSKLKIWVESSKHDDGSRDAAPHSAALEAAWQFSRVDGGDTIRIE
jgi:hypothetical protein